MSNFLLDIFPGISQGTSDSTFLKQNLPSKPGPFLCSLLPWLVVSTGVQAWNLRATFDALRFLSHPTSLATHSLVSLASHMSLMSICFFPSSQPPPFSFFPSQPPSYHLPSGHCNGLLTWTTARTNSDQSCWGWDRVTWAVTGDKEPMQKASEREGRRSCLLHAQKYRATAFGKPKYLGYSYSRGLS